MKPLVFDPVCRLVLCALCPLLSLPTLAAAQVTHVLQISVDSLGGTYLQFYLTNAPDQFPNFRRLQTEGASTFNARSDYESTESVPNHCTIVTGRPVLQPPGQPATVPHGYNNNFPGTSDTIHRDGNPDVSYKSSVFDVAHDRGLATAFYSGKSRLTICARSYDAANGGPDTIGEDNGPNKIDFVQIADTAGSNLVNSLLTNFATAPPHYSFLHLNDADSAGHSSGWGSAAWSNAVRQIDLQLGRIFAAVTASPALSNHTAIVLAADHGGGGVTSRTHNEPEYLANYTIPFFVWGPGIPPGINAYALFANRADPGTNRPDYNAGPQPLRNGDAANVGLSLLGLPPIPGSTLVPAWVPADLSLTIKRTGTDVTVAWPRIADAFELEGTDEVSPPRSWQAITQGLTANETEWVCTIANDGATPSRFFRLRRRDFTESAP